MTIVVADPDSRFRGKIKRQLEKITGVKVVGESSDWEEATAMILNRNPTVVIVNSVLHSGSGIEVLRRITHMMVTPTIIVVANDPSRDIRNACSLAGADFYFDKTSDYRKIIDTVRLLCVPYGQVEAEDSPFAPLDK